VIFRATEQWFINLDHKDLRQRALAEIRNVKWNPEWGLERLSNMLATRPDWCISRQRIWGVPIIVFYCESCNQLFTERAALAHVVELFSRETADVWYTKAPSELLPPGTKCAHCGSSKFRPERDILDVWFDSGASHLAVLGKQPDLPWPSDLYIEGGDQYRGWFHSSLLVAVGLRGRAPYRQVTSHGWVLDEQGRAMSKSLGNVIEPQAIIHSHGAELLRLWVASMDFRDDLRISKEMLDRLSESYRKIRNTFRFLLANIYDFDPARDQTPVDRMLEVDQWALHRAAQLTASCRNWYQEFAFHKVYGAVNTFCTVEMSQFYLDISKDRLYTAAPNSVSRRSVQTALYRIADALVRLVAPMLCFTSEEVWSHLPGRPAGTASVHHASFPEARDLAGELSAKQVERLGNWDRLIEVREEVLKKLEAARRDKFIGNALEAKVELSAEADLAALLQEYRENLPMLFIVSQVSLASGSLPGDTESAIPGLRIAIHRADGKKCERCWNYSLQVGKDKEFDTLCERCLPVVRSL
jgi:isoleucyl-tRNA synthetase